jgi:hypothetical protein
MPIRSIGPRWKRRTREKSSAVTLQLKAARAILAKEGRQLLALWEPVAYSSDIWGCISAASQLLSSVQGARNLILVTDAEPWGAQQRLPQVDLAGVRVTFAYFVCWRAVRCSRLTAMWGHALSARGAAPVRFFRPESSSGLFRSGLPDTA